MNEDLFAEAFNALRRLAETDGIVTISAPLESDDLPCFRCEQNRRAHAADCPSITSTTTEAQP